MSLTHHTDAEKPLSESLEKTTVVSRKVPYTYLGFTLLSALLFLGLASDGAAIFRLSTGSDLIQIPELTLPSLAVGWVVVVLLAACTAASFVFVSRRRPVPFWLTIVFAVLVVFGFLTWIAGGAQSSTIPLPGLLAGSLSLSIPLIFGALSGVLSERGGVVNIAIEGQMLFAAFSSAIVASITNAGFAAWLGPDNAVGPMIAPWVAIIAGSIAGVLVSFVLAAFAIKYLVEQIIVGVVVNVLVLGLTNFLFSQLLAPNRALLNTPPRFDAWPIPLLSEIPIIGPVLFRQTPLVYIGYILVFVVWWALYHTRWGLRLRAVGEHPQAADTVGINVNRTRFWNVSLGGAIAGLGGAFFTVSSSGAFNEDMTAGAGFIALAAVIFGRWHPLRAAAAALLFGFTTNLQTLLTIIGSPVPSEFMRMLPYIVTILAVAGFVGLSRPPAANGKPYIKS